MQLNNCKYIDKDIVNRRDAVSIDDSQFLIKDLEEIDDAIFTIGQKVVFYPI